MKWGGYALIIIAIMAISNVNTGTEENPEIGLFLMITIFLTVGGYLVWSASNKHQVLIVDTNQKSVVVPASKGEIDRLVREIEAAQNL